MRLEQVPMILGVLVLLVAAGIVYDAVTPDSPGPHRERRRRARAKLNLYGEWIVALGIALLGAALIGGEAWRWTTIAVIAAVVLIVVGGILNRSYLREMLMFRGASRRTAEHEAPPVAPTKDERKLRIR